MGGNPANDAETVRNFAEESHRATYAHYLDKAQEAIVEAFIHSVLLDNLSILPFLFRGRRLRPQFTYFAFGYGANLHPRVIPIRNPHPNGLFLLKQFHQIFKMLGDSFRDLLPIISTVASRAGPKSQRRCGGVLPVYRCPGRSDR